MKIKVETVFDAITGDYEMKFHNLSNPGEGMDYGMIKNMLIKIFGDFTDRIDNPDEPLPEDIYEATH
jgi:hypothetical protein